MSKQLFIEKNTELVEKCKQGNPKAQSEIYRLYAKAMFNVCLRILNHRDEAEDALQEAFVDAFAKIHTFRQESSFGAWLKRIMVNKSISTLRKRKFDWAVLEEASEYTTPPEADEGDYRIEAIMKGMAQLPEGYRVVLSLYLFEGYDHEEIGQILGISEATSRSQFMRGKQRLLAIIK